MLSSHDLLGLFSMRAAALLDSFRAVLSRAVPWTFLRRERRRTEQSPKLSINLPLFFALPFALAAQLPLGLQILPQDQRFGIFAELVPGVELTPDVFGYINADVGARFYF